MSYIYLNGKKRDLELSLGRVNLKALLLDCGVNFVEEGVAIAINTRVIPKSEWAHTAIKPKDRIEIVRPFSGG
jgi:thiamine biosynthesis protein ThiS|tara:strand:+ start:1396 stop:1614 length:219 start_codon:yes stop_codon:yes gene_type:complete